MAEEHARGWRLEARHAARLGGVLSWVLLGCSHSQPEAAAPAATSTAAPLPTASAVPSPGAVPSASATSSLPTVTTRPPPPPKWKNAALLSSYQKFLDAAERSADDRALDAGRKPAELLAFAGVEPGMQVAELAAGSGYTAEILARVVGPFGKVYGENPRWVLDRFAQAPWTERLQKDVMRNVVRVDAEMDDPLPGVPQLDIVFLIMFYHDSVWAGVDRPKMNTNIFKALKPGGKFIVVDHSSAPGAGTSAAQSLHRIEEPVVVSEVQAAGFQLTDSADFLRNPDDARDWNAAPSTAGGRRGTSDRFVLRFTKPATPVASETPPSVAPHASALPAEPAPAPSSAAPQGAIHAPAAPSAQPGLTP